MCVRIENLNAMGMNAVYKLDKNGMKNVYGRQRKQKVGMKVQLAMEKVGEGIGARGGWSEFSLTAVILHKREIRIRQLSNTKSNSTHLAISRSRVASLFPGCQVRI